MFGSPVSRFCHIRPAYSLRCAFALAASLLLTYAMPGLAQEAMFLRCADEADRVARVLCLETALEQAVKARDAQRGAATAATAPAAEPAAPSVTTAPPSTPVVTSSDDAAPSTSAGEEPRNFDLFGLFDRKEAEREKEQQQAREAMQAKVAELEFFKPDVLSITLDNGQVWRQIYSKRFGLREGDVVTIYQSGWGSQFRLETDRISGFIQVSRLR